MSPFMRSLLSSALLISHAIATPLTLDLEPRQQTCTPAGGVHIMLAGGCAIPCSGDTPGLLSTLVGNITQKYPSSDLYVVPYTNASTPAAAATPVMIQAINSYAASCPNTPIVLLGYSVGGIVIMNTLCGGISPHQRMHVIAAISYGEETYVANQLYDTGTCTNNAPKYPRNDTTSCQYWKYKLQDYCDGNDPACCMGGLVQATHYQYANNYDLKALAFIQKKYNQYVAAHP